jgi:hypothetical protein
MRAIKRYFFLSLISRSITRGEGVRSGLSAEDSPVGTREKTVHGAVSAVASPVGVLG